MSRLLKTTMAAVVGLCTLGSIESVRADYASDLTSLNPISYWRLGETSGTTAFDEMGVQDGTYKKNAVLGTPGAIPGDPNLSFQAWPGYVEIGNSNDYLLDNGTVSLCFQDRNSINFSGLFSKDSGGFDTGGHLTAFTTNDGRVRVRLQSTTQSYYVESDPFINLDTWYHFAFTFGDDGMALYLDGTLVDTNPYAGGLGTTSGGVGNYEPLVLGASTWVSGNLTANPVTNKFSGYIDEVAIFGEALSAQQIGGLNCASYVPEPGSLALLAVGLACSLRRRRRPA